MKCEKCGEEMVCGKVVFSNGGISLKSILCSPVAAFYAGNDLIDSRIADSSEGWYCGNCGVFTATFDVKRQDGSRPVFGNGLDLDLDDSIDRLPQKQCPDCGSSIDIDYPKCPDCGYSFGEDNGYND